MKRETLVGFTFLLSLWGCGSPGVQTPPSNPVSSPVPTGPELKIDSISPASALSGSTDFTLTITGTGFAPVQGHSQSVVVWRAAGHERLLLPNPQSATTAQLTAIVPAELLTTPLTAQIAVENGDPMSIGDGATYAKTNAVTFNVIAATSANSPFTPAGSMSIARDFHTATLLPDGRVLVAGGAIWAHDPDCETALKSTEVFDPQTLSFTGTADLGRARYGHTATLLANEKILIAGGGADCTPGTTSVEVFDPSSGKFSTGVAMHYRRTFHTATQLQDGRVLVAGGWPSDGGPTAELYDPASGQFNAPLDMTMSRAEHTATLLANGQVLIAGGYNSDSTLASAEIYDPGSGSFHATGAMSIPRGLHTATLLPDGRVLVAGGTTGDGRALASAEIYDPATGRFSRAGSMQNARLDHCATLLHDGRVLITGGYLGAGPDDSAELFDPKTGQFSTQMQMSDFRDGHSATLLGNGQVLLIGGGVASAELYQEPK
jgi:hypothetical protein